MSQHDMDLANQAGAAFRADANLALGALVTNSSGTAAPSTTFAYQWWADTTTGLLKIRNAANSAWITVGTLASTNFGLLPLAGGTMVGDLLFTDATCDIGKTGATRPRDIFASRNGVFGGTVAAGTGTSTFNNIATTGTVTAPGTPSFLATFAGSTDQTGDATAYTIPFATEIFDQSSNFAANTFTAPITGRYLLTAACHYYGLLAAHNNQILQIVTSNRTYGQQSVFGAGANPYTEASHALSVIADMDAGDTAIVKLTVSGGTKVVDIDSASNTFFSGQLIA